MQISLGGISLKKFSKIFALILVCISITTLFSGCSSDGLKFTQAIIKNQDIRSEEAKINYSIQLNISGLPEGQQQQADLVSQMLNNANITLNEKVVRNPETGDAKSEILSTFNIAGMSSNANIWVSTGITDGKPAVKEIFQLPPFATMAFAKQMSGKDYIVLDTSKVPGQTANSSVIDYSKYKDMYKEINAKTIEFYKNYAKNLNPDINLITLKGAEGVDGKFKTTYELKLTDATFKKLLNYLVKDLGTNKENLKLIEDYYASIMKLSTTMNPQANVSQEDLDKMFGEFEKQIPNFIEAYSKYSDALKDVTILGKDGITIDYVVDENGYIVNENSNIDINLDLGELSKALSNLTGQSEVSAGKISLKLNTKCEISKINENVEVSLPNITNENSVDYFEMLGNMVGNMGTFKETEGLYKNKVSILVDGNPVNFDKDPIIPTKGNVLVPARKAVDALGGTIDWDDSLQTATIKIGSNTAVLKMRSKEATLNGEAIKLDSPAILLFDKVYVPLNVLSDIAGSGRIVIGEE